MARWLIDNGLVSKDCFKENPMPSEKTTPPGCGKCGRPSGGKPTCGDCFLKANYGAEKTTPVPDELLRELTLFEKRVGNVALTKLLARFPSPPPLDPVEECAKAYDLVRGSGTSFTQEQHHGCVRAVIRRYRELGCPELP